MENKKANSKLVGALIVVIVLLLVCGGFLVYSLLSNKSDYNLGGTENNNQQLSGDSDDSSTNDVVNSGNTLYDVSKLNVKVLNGWNIFGDLSKNANEVEKIVLDKYIILLNLDGKVSLNGYINDKLISGSLNVSNVLDIVYFSTANGDESLNFLYLLTNNGDVYSYKLGNIDNKNFSVEKVNTVSNVQKLFISNGGKENSGGSWALFAITENNDCVMLNAASV